MRDARPADGQRRVGMPGNFVRLAADGRPGGHVRAHIQAPGPRPDGRRIALEMKIPVRIDKKRIGVHIAHAQPVPLARQQRVIHGQLRRLDDAFQNQRSVREYVAFDIRPTAGPAARQAKVEIDRYSRRAGDGVVHKRQKGVVLDLSDVLDVVEDVADHDVVLAGAGGNAVRLAGGLVVLVLGIVHKEIAFDMSVTAKIHRVVASTGEDVVDNLRDRVRARRPVQVDGVVVAGGPAEEIVFNDQRAVLGNAATHDMLALVVRGGLSRGACVGENAMAYDKRRIDRADALRIVLSSVTWSSRRLDFSRPIMPSFVRPYSTTA